MGLSLGILLTSGSRGVVSLLASDAIIISGGTKLTIMTYPCCLSPIGIACLGQVLIIFYVLVLRSEPVATFEKVVGLSSFNV